MPQSNSDHKTLSESLTNKQVEALIELLGPKCPPPRIDHRALANEPDRYQFAFDAGRHSIIEELNRIQEDRRVSELA